jgi:hypothetical protein
VIAAFIPNRELAGGVNLQGLVLFVLYAAGIVSAMAVAWCHQAPQRQGPASADAGTAGLPLAAPAQPGAGPVGTREASS